MFSFVRQLLGV